MRKLMLWVAFLSLSGCSSMPPVVKRGTLPIRADIAIVPFRDCLIPGQADCAGSGSTAGKVFVRVFSESSLFKAAPLPRPVDPTVALSDEDAVALARTKGFRFVINGEVDEYYDVAPFTFRSDRAGVTLRLLRVDDGVAIAFFSHLKANEGNLVTPADLIEGMAVHVRDSM